MGDRNRTAPRCIGCRMLPSLCLCALIERVPSATQVICVLHKMEQWKTTNTGFLMSKTLSACELRVRGEREQTLDTADLTEPSRRTLVLFPSDEARVLSQELLAEDSRPVRLVVPDATWQQARRIVRRVDALNNAEKVVLPKTRPSAYKLRKHAREGGLCTYEAITEALCIIEGEHVRPPLERLFRIFVDRTLFSRGDLKAADVEGGISAAALQWKGAYSSGILPLRFGKYERLQS
jgi:DTW domain-containing protein